jgi:hypothetical protein
MSGQMRFIPDITSLGYAALSAGSKASETGAVWRKLLRSHQFVARNTSGCEPFLHPRLINTTASGHLGIAGAGWVGGNTGRHIPQMLELGVASIEVAGLEWQLQTARY